MKTGVSTSVIAHAALLIVAIVGLGSAKPYEPEVVDSINIDLVPVGDITQVRAGSLDSKVIETKTPAVAESDKPAELAQPTGNTEENQITKEETDKATPAPVTNTAPPPAPDPTPAPIPDPDPAPTADPTPVPDTTPVADAAPPSDPAPASEEVAPPEELATPDNATPPEDVTPPPTPAARTNVAQLRADYKKQIEDEKLRKAAAEKKAKEDAKKAAEAKAAADQAARDADAIDQIINSEQSRGATTGAGGTPTAGRNDGTSASLSQDEMGRLIAHVKSCINMPPGAAEEGASVVISFNMTRDFLVAGQPQISDVTGPATGQIYASAAARAVVRCQSQDGGYSFLPSDKYDGANGWNAVKVTFRANE